MRFNRIKATLPDEQRAISPAIRRAAATLCIAVALAVIGLGYGWHEQQAQTLGPDREAALVGPPGVPEHGYQVIPDAPPLPLPPTPEQRLDARLSAFASQVEEAKASLDPSLVAFGAESLRGAIEQSIGRINDRAQVSVHIRDLESGRVLFDYYGDTLLNPASNHKLVTTSAALDLLGPSYMFETRVLLVGQTLYVIGEGDPTMDGEAVAELARVVAERIPAGAVTQIVIDDSVFSPQTLGPGYAKDGWGASYMAPSGALSVNFNTVEITVYPAKGARSPVVRVEPDSAHVVVDNRARMASATRLDLRSHPLAPEISEPSREQILTRVEVTGTLARTSRAHKVRRRVVDPGMFFGAVFARGLARFSQSAELPVRSGTAPSVALEHELADGDHLELPQVVAYQQGEDASEGGDVILVARHWSPPLIEIVGGLLTYSNNFTAEQLLRTLGWRMTGAPGDWDNGGAVVRGYWEALGNDPSTLVFENGAGLSRVGRITTAGLVELMSVAARSHSAGLRLTDALPIAGASGTVRARLQRSGKRVRAKSGTLNGVSGLTGVITTEAGEPQVAFSILINVRETDRMNAAARRQTEDRIVMAVLSHIDSWEAVRGPIIHGLRPMSVRPD